MPDIFLSYAREDRTPVSRLGRVLEDEGYDVFWDEKIPAGVHWSDYVHRQLDAAKCTIVFWSKYSSTSESVHDEAKVAFDRKSLIPLLLDGAAPPIGFGSLQNIQFRSWRGRKKGRAWRELHNALQRHVTPKWGPSLAREIAPYLPPLRRYARALMGTQQNGDEAVAKTLEAIVADPSAFIIDRFDVRVALYQHFHLALTDNSSNVGKAALLLLAIESFSPEESASILNVSVSTVVESAEKRLDVLNQQNEHARVFIIEDETVISMDLCDIVTSMGHTIVGIKKTEASAVAAVLQSKPDLVLADIQLEDGSSGIDAVQRILRELDVPVIFVTAFPDRLLTGTRPEPTFLLTKPYSQDMIRAAIMQALALKT